MNYFRLHRPRSSAGALSAGALFLALALPVGAQSPAGAQNSAPIAVTVNGAPVDFGGAAPVQSGGRTLVPLRAIFEALGASVEFQGGTIRARRGETALQLALGSTQANVNGLERTLEVPAQSVFGRTLVPLRFVGETFGANVTFNAATQTIAIVAPGAASNSGGALGMGTGSGGATLPSIPAPTPVAPVAPYVVPGVGQSVNGTFVRAESAPRASVTLSVAGALKTYALSDNPLVLRQISLASAAGATPVRQGARPTALTSLVAGEPVRLSLDSGGRAAQITATATVVVARVQFAGVGRIVLDDERDTPISIGETIRFVDAAGRVATDVSGLTPGQNIGLFLSREGNVLYQVSAYAPDFTPVAATGNGAGTPDPLPAGAGLPPAGAPQIQLVSSDATGPFKAGARLTVTVRATPGLRASFSLGPKIQNITLSEDAAQPGVYSAAYTVRAGDDVLNARIAARVLDAGGLEGFGQSADAVTIDTIAPRLVGTFPASGAQIAVAQPNIAIFADDLGGSGLGAAQIDLVSGSGANQITTRLPATIAPPTSISAVAPAPLSGASSVRAVITDRAGNALRVNFAFNVVQGAGAITSFSHGASRAVAPGDDVPLALSAQPAGRATFDVLNKAGQTIAQGVPLAEEEPGKYRATFRVPASASGQLRFVGKFTDSDGAQSQLEATTRVSVATAAVKLSIQSPVEGDTATSPLTVRGQAAPGAQIDVSLSAQGTQFFILEYKQDLGTQQTRADERGNWTLKLDLPALRQVSGLKFVISATQTDAAGKASAPVSVTVAR